MYRYRELIKPLLPKKAPEELYHEKVWIFWMDSKELGGYPGHFMIRYFFDKEACHPVHPDKCIVHPYNELLVFAGTDPSDLLYLGARIKIFIGAKEYILEKSSVAIIPANVPHGQIIVEHLERPFILITHSDGLQYAGEVYRKSTIYQFESKEQGFVKTLYTSQSAREELERVGPIKIDDRGVCDLRQIGPGEAYQFIQMNPEDLNGVNISFSLEFCGTAGAWMNTKYGHVHPEPELLIGLSLSPEDPFNLGASLEFWFGSEREVYVLDKPVAISIPRPWIVHTPLITQKVDRPFMFMLVCPGTYTRAAWVETGYDPI